jgi:hypothetical protein
MMNPRILRALKTILRRDFRVSTAASGGGIDVGRASDLACST